MAEPDRLQLASPSRPSKPAAPAEPISRVRPLISDNELLLTVMPVGLVANSADGAQDFLASVILVDVDLAACEAFVQDLQWIAFARLMVGGVGIPVSPEDGDHPENHQ